MDRNWLLKQWNDAWTEGLWTAAWSKSVEDLTPQQAAWKPAPGRHSIWQIVAHMVFWREDALERLETGRAALPDAEVNRRNFPEPTEISTAAWSSLLSRFRKSHERVAAVIPDATKDLIRLQYLLAHDSYHIGQINLIRALQGLKPIE
jgi:hypothetical protein